MMKLNTQMNALTLYLMQNLEPYKLSLRFFIEKLEKLSFQEIISDFFDETFQNFIL